MAAHYHEENKAERLLRREMSRRGLRFRQSEMVAGREIDFYLPDCFLAVEIDGLSHLAADVRRRDADKERLLAERGIALLRLPNEEVLADVRGCVERIASYQKAWHQKVATAGPAPEETPFQRQLRTWAKRAGFNLSGGGGE